MKIITSEQAKAEQLQEIISLQMDRARFVSCLAEINEKLRILQQKQ